MIAALAIAGALTCADLPSLEKAYKDDLSALGPEGTLWASPQNAKAISDLSVAYLTATAACSAAIPPNVDVKPLVRQLDEIRQGAERAAPRPDGR